MNKTLNEFRDNLSKYLPNKIEQEKFLNQPSSAFGGQSPNSFLLHSRRKDKLAFAVATLKALFENEASLSNKS